MRPSKEWRREIVTLSENRYIFKRKHNIVLYARMSECEKNMWRQCRRMAIDRFFLSREENKHQQ